MVSIFNKKKKYTEKTLGTVVNVFRSLYVNDGRPKYTIEYYDGYGNKFILKEWAKYKTTFYKVGKITIGNKNHIEFFNVGDKVTIMYNPKKPQKAYIEENTRKVESTQFDTYQFVEENANILKKAFERMKDKN